MIGLTSRQAEILEFIRDYFAEQQCWPSIRDIQRAFGFRSTNAVAGHLRLLEAKGRLVRVSGRARAFRLPEGDLSEVLPGDVLPLVELPVYGNIAAGYPDGVEPGDAVDRLQVDFESAGLRRTRRSFALRVNGDSMIDAGIEDGDVVVVEPREPRNGDIVVALIDGQSTLKRFVAAPDRPPYLKSENRLYPAFHPREELIIQGVATSVVRRLA